MRRTQQNIERSARNRAAGPAAEAGESQATLVQAVEDMIQSEFACLKEHQPHLLRLAVNEAAALAWVTQFPHLFFPSLASEKARAVAAWHRQQEAAFSQDSHARRAA